MSRSKLLPLFVALFLTIASAVAGNLYLPGQPQIFTSTAQTITSAGALTIAHGLGTRPKECWYELTCGTTNAGYAVNDVLNGQSTSSNYTDGVLIGGNVGPYPPGVSIVPDATNLNIRFANVTPVFCSLNKGTGTRAALTNGSWTITFYARP